LSQWLCINPFGIEGWLLSIFLLGQAGTTASPVYTFQSFIAIRSKLMLYSTLYYTVQCSTIIMEAFISFLPTYSDLHFLSPPRLGPPRHKYKDRRHVHQYYLRQRVLHRSSTRPPSLIHRSPTYDPSPPRSFDHPLSSIQSTSSRSAPVPPSHWDTSVHPAQINSWCSTIDFIGIHRLSSMFSTAPFVPDFEHIQQEWHRLCPILYNSSVPSPFNRYLGPSCIFMSTQEESVPVVIDSGASNGLSPFRSDFVQFVECDGSITGIGAQSAIKGFGKVRWKIVDQEGEVQVIESEAYYVPSSQIRLYSPQRDFQREKSGSLTLTWDKCALHLPGAKKAMHFPYHSTSHLPLMISLPHDKDSKRALVVEEDLSLPSMYQAADFSPSPMTAPVEPPDVSRPMINNAILDEQNINLSRAQRELLGWHYKLGHVSMYSIQRFMHPLKPLDNANLETEYATPCLITTRNQRTHSCQPPKCAACILAKMERCPTSTQVTPGSKNKHSLKGDDLAPGDCISMDQYVVTQKGRSLTKSSNDHEKYNGGTIYVDHSSGFLYNHNQISLRSGETLVGKRLLERNAAENGHVLRHFRADNGVFTSAEFKQDLEAKRQSIKFSGVGAHHQNGIAERSIKTISYLARAMLIHSALRWPAKHDIELWPFALDHAVYV
jgi:hypothetical protein